MGDGGSGVSANTIPSPAGNGISNTATLNIKTRSSLFFIAFSLDTDFRFLLPNRPTLVAGGFLPLRTPEPAGQKSEVLFSATLQPPCQGNVISLSLSSNPAPRHRL
jgi:hypothetical protein